MRFIVFNKFTGKDISIRESAQCLTPQAMLDHTFGPGNGDQMWGCAEWPHEHDPEKMVDLTKYDDAGKKFTGAHTPAEAMKPDVEFIAAKAARAAKAIATA